MHTTPIEVFHDAGVFEASKQCELALTSNDNEALVRQTGRLLMTISIARGLAETAATDYRVVNISDLSLDMTSTSTATIDETHGIHFPTLFHAFVAHWLCRDRALRFANLDVTVALQLSMGHVHKAGSANVRYAVLANLYKLLISHHSGFTMMLKKTNGAGLVEDLTHAALCGLPHGSIVGILEAIRASLCE